MTGMQGADISALSALSHALGDASAHLTRLRVALVTQLNSVYWEGPDSLAVRDECRTRWTPMLDGAAELLAEAQRAIELQIRQQLDASSGAVGALDPGRGWAIALDLSPDVIRQALADVTPSTSSPPDEGGLTVLPSLQMPEHLHPIHVSPWELLEDSGPVGDVHLDWIALGADAGDPPR